MIKKKLIKPITKMGVVNFQQNNYNFLEPLKKVGDNVSLDLTNYYTKQEIDNNIGAIDTKATTNLNNITKNTNDIKEVNLKFNDYYNKQVIDTNLTNVNRALQAKQDKLIVGAGLNLNGNNLTLTQTPITLEQVKQEIAKAELDDLTLENVEQNLIAPINTKIQELENKDIQLQQSINSKLDSSTLATLATKQELATKQDKLSQAQLDNINNVPNKLDKATYDNDKANLVSKQELQQNNTLFYNKEQTNQQIQETNNKINAKLDTSTYDNDKNNFAKLDSFNHFTNKQSAPSYIVGTPSNTNDNQENKVWINGSNQFELLAKNGLKYYDLNTGSGFMFNDIALKRNTQAKIVNGDDIGINGNNQLYINPDIKNLLNSMPITGQTRVVDYMNGGKVINFQIACGSHREQGYVWKSEIPQQVKDITNIRYVESIEYSLLESGFNKYKVFGPYVASISAYIDGNQLVLRNESAIPSYITYIRVKIVVSV